jgi:PAS domain S-box-containing protein
VRRLRLRCAAREERLRTIVNTAADSIVVFDEAGRIESVNPASTRIFGYAPAEMVGNNVSMLMAGPDWLAHDGDLRNVLDTGNAKVIGTGQEVEGRRKDGTIFPVDLAVVEWRLEGKRHFTSIMRDISERRRREDQIKLLLREVNHRSKNMLAAVQAVARQTIASSPEDFLARFGERIQALAAAQDLLI